MNQLFVNEDLENVFIEIKKNSNTRVFAIYGEDYLKICTKEDLLNLADVKNNVAEACDILSEKYFIKEITDNKSLLNIKAKNKIYIEPQEQSLIDSVIEDFIKMKSRFELDNNLKIYAVYSDDLYKLMTEAELIKFAEEAKDTLDESQLLDFLDPIMSSKEAESLLLMTEYYVDELVTE